MKELKHEERLHLACHERQQVDSVAIDACHVVLWGNQKRRHIVSLSSLHNLVPEEFHAASIDDALIMLLKQDIALKEKEAEKKRDGEYNSKIDFCGEKEEEKRLSNFDKREIEPIERKREEINIPCTTIYYIN